MISPRDRQVIRDLAQEYADIAAQPVQQERRDLWRAHNSLRTDRPLVLATYGYHNVWCREVFGEETLQCEDPFYRAHERMLRMAIFHDPIGDDLIAEPWVTQGASHRTRGGWTGPWGVDAELQHPGEGGAFKVTGAALKTWDDVARMTVPRHDIDEEATQRNVERLREVVDGLLAVDVNRGPVLWGFLADISTSLAYLRGLEQVMVDMYESPEELRNLLAFMRDGILANQQQAEAAGDLTLTCGHNGQEAYAEELEEPTPNSGPRARRDLWGFFAAQEFTLISPAFHDEFLYQYQLPIMERFGLTHYGCCEDLTRKIDMLRQAENLRSIAVTPVADIARCAEQIGGDYVISWRPNPTDMVCAAWDEERIRRIIGEGLRAARGTNLHLHLKDIETVQGEPTRLRRWVEVVRSVIDEVW
ncbi:MAG: hypothetical protein FJX74_02545 [Armatimonadetes bacterium]|nr:hypothetical protein [Armatimonadota bacterium]